MFFIFFITVTLPVTASLPDFNKAASNHCRRPLESSLKEYSSLIEFPHDPALPAESIIALHPVLYYIIIIPVLQEKKRGN